MRITIEIVARLQATGMRAEELVREYLRGSVDADRFERLSTLADGDARGRKLDRDEIHEGRSSIRAI